jgi:hypothetical protein
MKLIKVTSKFIERYMDYMKVELSDNFREFFDKTKLEEYEGKKCIVDELERDLYFGLVNSEDEWVPCIAYDMIPDDDGLPEGVFDILIPFATDHQDIEEEVEDDFSDDAFADIGVYLVENNENLAVWRYEEETGFEKAADSIEEFINSIKK